MATSVHSYLSIESPAVEPGEGQLGKVEYGGGIVKLSRMTTGSLATVLSPLAGIAALLAGALPASGADVPFTERVISTAANGAISVFATDMDGDGDIDVLSASFNDDKIAWYDSDGGSPPTFTERVISTAANRAFSVFATDVDGDGDIDVLSASANDDKIAWYENTSPFDSDLVQFLVDLRAEGIITGQDLGAILKALNSSPP